MPERWLQIKGDPAVRQFLFSQQRVESLFDEQIDRVHAIVHALLTRQAGARRFVSFHLLVPDAWPVDRAASAWICVASSPRSASTAARSAPDGPPSSRSSVVRTASARAGAMALARVS